uniref:Uncharacterized protein n=1 Tax=Cyclophora tenuis TaxID=216820 RepID=A0A7S1D688_CYCTE|mmetsp:Transcript_23522/g.39903  ORF Transcript_23522/g.39903 Transcript_23522/m.39903 type:complete len:195 (+) Transcript_23522:2-586(+)
MFQFNPHLHFSTNMWTAQCDYIQHLSPPKEYEAIRVEMCRQFLARTTQPRKCCLNESSPSEWTASGMGRHSMEWWISSHPALRPCQAMKMADAFYKYTTGLEPQLIPELTPPVRLPPEPSNSTLDTLRFALQQFYYLHGTISGGLCEMQIEQLNHNLCSPREQSNYLRNISPRDNSILNQPQPQQEPQHQQQQQ